MTNLPADLVEDVIQNSHGVQMVIVDYSATKPLAQLRPKDRVNTPCDQCGGSGLFTGPSGWTISNKYGPGANKGCFACNGYGYRSVLVSSIRQRVARTRKAEIERQKAAEAYEACRGEREAAEAKRLAVEQAAHQAKIDAAPKEYLGGLKVRVRDIPVTIKYASTYESSYGYHSQIGAFIVAETAEGHPVKISGTGETLFGWFKGDAALVTGTVKEHGEYQDIPQTILTRVVMTKVEA